MPAAHDGVALVLLIGVPLAGCVAYGLWMASKFGLISLRPRSGAAERR